MKMETVNYHTNLIFHNIVIEYEIKLKYDPDKILSFQTIVGIFDKR